MLTHPFLRRLVLLAAALLAAISVVVALWTMFGAPARADAVTDRPSIPQTSLAPGRHADVPAAPLPRPPKSGWRAEPERRADTRLGDIAPVPYGIERGWCDRRRVAGETIGGVVGVVGVIGSEVGAGRGGQAIAIAGTAAGPLVGATIGRSMDDVDHHCVGRILEYAPDHHRVRWYDDTRDLGYGIVPMHTFQDRSGLYCREYVATATIAGRQQQGVASACRGPNGAWQMMRSE